MKKHLRNFAMFVGMISIATVGCKKDDNSTTSAASIKAITTNALSYGTTLGKTVLSAEVTDATPNSDGSVSYGGGSIAFNSSTGIITYTDVTVDSKTTNGTITPLSNGSTNMNLTITEGTSITQLKDYNLATDSSGNTITNGTVIVTSNGKIYTLTFTDIKDNDNADYASSGTLKIAVTGGDTITFEFLAGGLCNVTVNSESKQTNLKQSDLGF